MHFLNTGNCAIMRCVVGRYDSATEQLYIYPPEAVDGMLAAEGGEAAAAQLTTWHAGTFATLDNSSYVTIQGLAMEGSTTTLVVVTGGNHNTIGGCTLKNAAHGVTLSGGHNNRVVGNDIYDVGGHISSSGDGSSTAANLVPTNNVIENNHITNVYLTDAAWSVRVSGVGDRFSHNLIHDAPGQVLLPNGPLTMIDHNEVFNTGYVEGDGGVMYMVRQSKYSAFYFAFSLASFSPTAV
jgi:parallel beta-helix repeat protein